mmetsp:Transcript_25303/g.55070  ORF Transcript_25303/g.55070 Transcript_25303/m.55070 type:complete len:247 (-) Transcript_25303:121-861(-)
MRSSSKTTSRISEHHWKWAGCSTAASLRPAAKAPAASNNWDLQYCIAGSNRVNSSKNEARPTTRPATSASFRRSANSLKKVRAVGEPTRKSKAERTSYSLRRMLSSSRRPAERCERMALHRPTGKLLAPSTFISVQTTAKIKVCIVLASMWALGQAQYRSRLSTTLWSRASSNSSTKNDCEIQFTSCARCRGMIAACKRAMSRGRNCSARRYSDRRTPSTRATMEESMTTSGSSRSSLPSRTVLEI